MDPRSVVEAAIARWATQDVESSFVYVAEDVVYVLHIAEDLTAFAGVTEGKEAMKAAFYKMIEEYDYLKWEPVIMGVAGDLVRVQTQFRFRHRRTGTDLEGSMRTNFTIRDGLIVRCEEHVDRGHVEAFMRLARQREAMNDIDAPPEIPRRARAGPVNKRTKVSCENGCNVPDEES